MIWLCYNIMFVYCYWGGFLLFIRRPCKQLYIHYVNKITIRMQEYIVEAAKSKEKGPHEKRVTQSHDRGAFRGILNIVCWSSLFFNKFGIVIIIHITVGAASQWWSNERMMVNARQWWWNEYIIQSFHHHWLTFHHH